MTAIGMIAKFCIFAMVTLSTFVLTAVVVAFLVHYMSELKALKAMNQKAAHDILHPLSHRNGQINSQGKRRNSKANRTVPTDTVGQ